MFPGVSKSRPKGDNITIVYTTLDYKWKVMHDEEDTTNFSPMR